MPLTKGDLIQIKETVGLEAVQQSLDKLNETNVTLQNSLKNIDDKFSKLEVRLEKDVAEIRLEVAEITNSNKTLTDIVTSNKTTIDESIGKLTEKLSALESTQLVNPDEFLRFTTQFHQLQAKVVRLEKDVYRGLQHDRLWNIEIEGIPTNIGDDPSQLEKAALAIFDAINVECYSENIEAIHRLPARVGIKPTILCIDSRKIVRNIHLNKNKLKDLKNLNLNIPGLTESSKLFINPSLTPYSKRLAYNCRVLRRAGHVTKIRIESDGLIKIVKQGEHDYTKIMYESDLTSSFPTFTGFRFGDE